MIAHIAVLAMSAGTIMIEIVLMVPFGANRSVNGCNKKRPYALVLGLRVRARASAYRA